MGPQAFYQSAVRLRVQAKYDHAYKTALLAERMRPWDPAFQELTRIMRAWAWMGAGEFEKAAVQFEKMAGVTDNKTIP